jgi:hypothetical protein
LFIEKKTAHHYKQHPYRAHSCWLYAEVGVSENGFSSQVTQQDVLAAAATARAKRRKIRRRIHPLMHHTQRK